MISRVVGIGIAEHQQRAGGWTMNQARGGLQHRDAGAFCAHQSPSNMKSILWQQLFQAVSRDATWDVGVSCADQVGVFVSQLSEPDVYLTTPTALANDLVEFLVARFAALHTQPIIGGAF